MNDDMELAESELLKGNSAFHKLGLGLVSFMRAVLSFEKDMLAEAQKRLSEAESSATEALERSKRSSFASDSAIYKPGTEYSLCQAQVQLMSAVIGMLNESMGDKFGSLMKISNAYGTLDKILEQEKQYLDSIAAKEPKVEGKLKPDAEGSDDEFVDVAEEASQIPELEARLEVEKSDTGPDPALFASVLDGFIHTSSNMCFGMLQLMLTMMPPTVARAASWFGFKGDRERGISLLWQASKFGNLNGAFAGLVLLGFYNGFIGFCDILPPEGSKEFPKEKCQALITEFRTKYPKVSSSID
jgi:hypothetical protein